MEWLWWAPGIQPGQTTTATLLPDSHCVLPIFLLPKERFMFVCVNTSRFHR